MGEENSDSEVNTLADLIPKVTSRIETYRESVREACRKIADLYQFNHNSLCRKYQRSSEKKDRAHKNMKFSDEEEEIICALILSFSSRGSALTRGILIELVKKTLELGGLVPSVHGSSLRSDNNDNGKVLRPSACFESDQRTCR